MIRINPDYRDPDPPDRWPASDILVREEPDEEEDEEDSGEEDGDDDKEDDDGYSESELLAFADSLPAVLIRVWQHRAV